MKKKEKKLTPDQLQNKKIISKLSNEVKTKFDALTPATAFSDADGLNEKLNLLKIYRSMTGEDEGEVINDLNTKFGNSGNGFNARILESPIKQLAKIKVNIDKQASDAKEKLYGTFARMQEYADSEQGIAEFDEMKNTFSKYANDALRNGVKQEHQSSGGEFSLGM